jgi:cytochrome c oxidase subunit IV
MTTHVVNVKTYLYILFSLLVLTVATTEIAKIDLGVFNTMVAMAISALKTSLVVLFFMHMKWSPNRLRVVASIGLLWLFIMIALTLGDYMTRSWTYRPQAWEKLTVVGPPSH